jgi:hypothetical protein
VISNPKANALIITTINGHFSLELMVTILRQLLHAKNVGESASDVTSRLNEITTNRIKVTKVHDLEEICLVWAGEVISFANVRSTRV